MSSQSSEALAAKVAAVHALLPVLQQQAAAGAAAASAARAEIMDIAAREEAQAAQFEDGKARAVAERQTREASAAQLAERSHIHATSLVAELAKMNEELEAAARDHAATTSELAQKQAQTSDEVTRAAASVGVQLTRAPQNAAPTVLGCELGAGTGAD